MAAPFFSTTTSLLPVSLAYALPAASTAMSLQVAPAVGSGHLPFGAPLFRSKACSVEGAGAAPGCGGPGGLPEHAYSVFDLSSANTPKTPCRPSVPGLIQASAVAAPGAALKIVLPSMLPTMTVPSAVDVRLSVIRRSPGMVMAAGGAAACAAAVRAATATSAETAVLIPFFMCESPRDYFE